MNLKQGWLVASLLIAIAAAGALLVSAIRRGRAPAALLAAAFLLGFARMAAASPDVIAAGNHNIEGVVCSVSDTDKGTVLLKNASIDGDPLKYRVKLKLGDGRAEVGDRIEAEASVSNPTRRFGTYNERLVLLSSGVSVSGKAESFVVKSNHSLPVTEWFSRLKKLLEQRISEVFGTEADIAAGFLLGNKTGMDEAESENFKTTGTAHLLSLSGFHVGIITALLLLVLPKRYPVGRAAAVGIFLFIYCGVAAFTPSLVRASIMCMAVLLADIFMKPRDALSSLSLAAMIILMISPYKLWSAGFVLSFSATFGIIAATSAGAWSTRSMTLNKLLGLITATLGATAATVLVSARYFGYFPTYGLLANITAVPVFSLAVTLSFVVLLIGIPFPAAASVLAFVPRALIRLASRILDAISALPYSRLDVIRPSMFSFLLMLILIFTVSPFVLRPLKKRLKIALPVFLLFTASLAADIIRA